MRHRRGRRPRRWRRRRRTVPAATPQQPPRKRPGQPRERLRNGMQLGRLQRQTAFLKSRSRSSCGESPWPPNRGTRHCQGHYTLAKPRSTRSRVWESSLTACWTRKRASSVHASEKINGHDGRRCKPPHQRCRTARSSRSSKHLVKKNIIFIY